MTSAVYSEPLNKSVKRRLSYLVNVFNSPSSDCPYQQATGILQCRILSVPEIFPRCNGFPGHAGVLSRRVASPLLASEGWGWIGTDDDALSPQCGDFPVSSRHQAWSLPTRREPNWRTNGLQLRRSFPAAEYVGQPHTPLTLATAPDEMRHCAPGIDFLLLF